MRQFISGWRELPGNYNLFASPQAGSSDKLNTLPMNTQTLLEEVHKILKPSDILQINYFNIEIIVKVTQFDFDTFTNPNKSMEPIHFVFCITQCNATHVKSWNDH